VVLGPRRLGDGDELTRPDPRRAPWARIAVAILVAAGAAVLLLQLRAGEVDAPAVHPPLTSADSAPPARAQANPPGRLASADPAPADAAPAAPVAGAPASSPGIGERLHREASEGVERLRGEMMNRCGDTMAGERKPMRFRVQLTFDATGTEIARSVVAEQRSPQRISNCLTLASPGSLRVTPPGVDVSTTVRLTLP
jgi:hypothetical protein